MPDIVIDGVTGYLVPVKDSKALAEAILKMVANPQNAKAMALKGKEHYAKLKEENNGSIERIYAKMVEHSKNQV